MLFVHEVHHVAGKQENRFEDLYREWAAQLAKGDDARLLWFMHQAHGAGPAYVFVTVTAVASSAALDDLNARRRAGGDLHALTAEVDSLRHSSVAKILEPAPFSPLMEVDLASVPVTSEEPADGVLPLFMEDTAWPHPGRFDDYLKLAGSLYLETLRAANERMGGKGLLDLVAAFIPRYGSGVHREIVLWQRINNQDGLLPLFNREVPDAYKRPGSWMIDALDVRDQWESRLLRVSGWSPLG
jgi:hypothetical protein